MTVIAWDGKTLAADRQMTWADMRSTACKIRRLPNGDVIAGSGDSGKVLTVFDWYENGANPERWPKCQTPEDFARLIVAKPGRKIVYYDFLPIQQEILEPIMAFGAGRDYALGAMAMGADARTAIEIASRFSAVCGMGVDAFEVE